MNQKYNQYSQKFIICGILSLFLIGFNSYSFAVQDNVIIDGNLNPTNRSEELYVVRVSPVNEDRDIIFSVYDSGENIVSQKSYIKSGGSYENFFIKFFSPVFQDNKKYTIEVKGPGLIGREVITIKEEFRSYTSEPVTVITSSEEKRLVEEKIAKIQIDKPKTQCGKGTVLENGLCTIIPNYYAISTCETVGGNYDSVKLSCIIPISPIPVKSAEHLSEENLDNEENQDNEEQSSIGIYIVVIFVTTIIISSAIIKSKKKQRLEKKNWEREKVSIKTDLEDTIVIKKKTTDKKEKLKKIIWADEKKNKFEKEKERETVERNSEREKFLEEEKIRNDVERERVQQEKIEEEKFHLTFKKLWAEEKKNKFLEEKKIRNEKLRQKRENMLKGKKIQEKSNEEEKFEKLKKTIWADEKKNKFKKEKERKINLKKKFLEEEKIRNDVERERVQQEKIEGKKTFTKKIGLAAINYCDDNNIGSKSKLRRLKMKFEKWSWENERDVETMRLEYNIILDMIKKFESQ